MQQPERTDIDGPMGVARGFSDDHIITISVTHAGVEQRIMMTEFNAWRVFGSLAMLLGVQLSKKVAKGIRF